MSRGGYRCGAGRPGWHAKTAGKLAVEGAQIADVAAYMTSGK